MNKEMNKIPKNFEPNKIEDKWYRYWEENKLFHSEPDEREPYTIVIPPPNVTGMLHLGHILNNTLQDVYIRYKRMKGFNACWVPGVDHASIATESKVINHLKTLGMNKYEIGREKFLEYCWEWTEKYGGIIFKQLRKLGVSLDWDRKRFTMDEHYYKKVIEAFVKLYKEGLIYKGYRMVNWDPASKSAISDEEVLFREVKGKLWYIKYPVADSDKHLVIATTRPETMFGDTAVAVNPNDDRYKDVIGKEVILPIVGRKIPIIADEYVDMEFGTGALKITPAHDINDYEIGKRHNLETINIFNPDASTNENVPEKFRNLDRDVAQKKVVEELKESGALLKEEDYTHNVGYSDRGGVPIEPYLSEQWFMKMDELAQPALKVVREGLINFHPQHWVKTYEHWMTNIKDWCISRQLWWGHRIPVWYHKETGEIYCETEPPKDIENWRQEDDVLDTWASSWLWAQDVFTTPEELAYYYPTDLLVTGPDIIFFWVARMIMAGMHFRTERQSDAEKIPFKDVYFTSIIRDGKGRKMSKSLGNSPDPIDVINDYGADALRFTITYIAPLGQDVLFSTDKCELGRNFANKIWNAGRFLLMNTENIRTDKTLADKHIDFTDEWILTRFEKALKKLEDSLDGFDITGATKTIYSFVWNDFCDWYVELAKKRLYSDDEEVKSAVLTRALSLFGDILKMIHPFMPFISEELWQLVEPRKEGESISVSEFPIYEETKINENFEENVKFLQELVTAIRNIRGELNIPPVRRINLVLKTDKVTPLQVEYLKSLVRTENVTVDANASKPAASASGVIKDCEIFVPLQGIIDLEDERERIGKELARLEGALKGVEKKLSNEKFVNNAPKDVVEKEKTKQKDWSEKIEKLKRFLKDLD